jgi:aminotransferase EvaB
MSIQVWDYRAEFDEERDEILAAVERVFRSGRLILGASVRAFEEEFAAYCGARFGVGVNSGTDALVLALLALGLQPGDEVVTVSNTAIPTVSAIVTAGGRPRFVDIDRRTYLMDVAQLERAITPRTRAVIAVHLFGQCVDMDFVNEVAGRRGLKVIEDCAQSHGARLDGRLCGTMSHAAAFSFYPTKILGGYGDGGMIVSDDESVAARLRRIRMYGTDGSYFALEHGYNSRLDEVHAEILRGKLKRLERYIARRRELAARYDRLLADTDLVLPRVADRATHAYYLYVVAHPRREEILDRLKGHDIHVNISYPWPIHTMPPYAQFGCGPGDLPVTEAAAQQIFSLPMYPSLTNEQQDDVCARLHDILATLRP